jgi:hypothetical protein
MVRRGTFDNGDLSDLQDAATKFNDAVNSVVWMYHKRRIWHRIRSKQLRALRLADAELTAMLARLRVEKGAK